LAISFIDAAGLAPNVYFFYLEDCDNRSIFCCN